MSLSVFHKNCAALISGWMYDGDGSIGFVSSRLLLFTEDDLQKLVEQFGQGDHRQDQRRHRQSVIIAS
ncbi:MAG TPA: hypothetical protein VIT21_04125 [Chthoniobacterales bacterium]